MEIEEITKLTSELSDYWNTRIIKHNEHGETYYGIHEVYYDKDDKPVMWSDKPIKIVFEDEEELNTILRLILEAKYKTILELKDEELIDTNIKL